MSTTALEQIGDAFDLLNVYQPGDTISAVDQAKGLRILNNMIKGWNLEALISPVNIRETFPIVAGKGSPTNPYTIGVGGDLNTSRPPTNSSLTGCAILLGMTGVEIARSVLTDDQYNALKIKGLTNGLATWAYYNPTYAGGFGTFQLWPVPNVSTDTLVLYRAQPFAQFVSISASYDLPEGLEETITYNLARRLKTPYGRAMAPDDLAMADVFLSRWKIANVEMDDLPVDPMWIGSNPRGGYNIQTGS